MLTPLIKELQESLQHTPSKIQIKESLHLCFNESTYGCQKAYPVAIVHEKTRITDPVSLTFFTQSNLIDTEGFTPCTYDDTQIEQIVAHAPDYIQRVNYMVASSKSIPKPAFFNKFKHDYWKKIQSVDGLEAVIEVTVLADDTTACEAEASLRAIIRKRKEVHQLKKLTFVWIVEIEGQSNSIERVLKHYFKEDYTVIRNAEKSYYLGWSTPLQSINMRYFVCPPQ
ncbi:hypothetical protein MN086_00850 [Sulfurovum sp. XGS-02]|uniref:hypothetical protein n=1 Tax=Sulfurovum sp. XGS-02 TaxID=2925411 RepID=UPI0020472F44|nr:hypothetical protein [Sulfurovum sp. XGS-02]UPT77706.1 hypothetical protein MN086_00850 [Sulfurovum sp. XGS-02]